MNTLTIPTKRLCEHALVPQNAYKGDAGYDLCATQDITIALNLDPQNNIEIHIGDRIAQLVIIKVEAIHFNEVDDLEHSDRGEGGFGSSGVSHSI